MYVIRPSQFVIGIIAKNSSPSMLSLSSFVRHLTPRIDRVVVHSVYGEEWFGVSKNQHWQLFTTDSTGAAASPPDCLLTALAASAGDNVKYLLEANKKIVKSMQVNVEGEWAPGAPRRFSEIRLKFSVDSPDASQSDVARIANVVLATLDPVGNTLQGKPKVSTKVTLIKP
jgi:uncharacterized OsmC-like protein